MLVQFWPNKQSQKDIRPRLVYRTRVHLITKTKMEGNCVRLLQRGSGGVGEGVSLASELNHGLILERLDSGQETMHV